MATDVRQLRVFVASPGDVQAERRRMKTVIDDLNQSLPGREGVTLELWRWEENAKPDLGEPQALINPELDKADIVVVILWTRIGTPTPRGASGTAEEVLRSVERWQASGTPRVMIYLCKRQKLPDDIAQYAAMDQFVRGLRGESIQVPFKSTADFERKVRKHLDDAATSIARAARSAGTPATPDGDAGKARGGANRPRQEIDVERYLRHVEATYGSVVLTGLLGDKAAPALPVEQIYVPLRATRTGLKVPADRRGTRAGSVDPVQTLAEQLRHSVELGGKHRPRGSVSSRRRRVALALTSIGVPRKEAKRPEVADAVLQRLESAGPQVAPEIVREILTTVEFEDAYRGAAHLLVEGDPGSGKTTTLQHVAMALVRARRGDADPAMWMGFRSPWPLPVFVALRRFRAWLGQRSHDRRDGDVLVDYIRETEAPAGGGTDWIVGALASGRVAVLLDGVDEVPDPAARARVAAILADFIGHFAKCRVAVTSRPAGLDPEVRRVLVDVGGLAHCTVRPLDAGLQDRFVHSWYRALIPDAADADRRATELITRVRANPKVAELANTPIMLTAIAVVHQTVGSLPERRADLYEHCVRALAGRWDAARDDAGQALCGPVGLDAKVGLLEEVAFRIHEQGEQGQTMEAGPLHDLARAEFRRALACDVPPETCRDLVARMAERSGLVIPAGARDFRFRHLTFQEFLTARRICDRCDDPIGVLAHHLGDGWWREVIQLAAGYKGIYSAAEARRLVSGLLDRARAMPEVSVQVAALASACRALLDLRGYGIPDLADVARSVHPALVGLIEHPAQPGAMEDRGVLCDVLGSFGDDPRLTAARRWARLPGGSFEMGGADGDANPWEKPVHRVEVPAFDIQRWPVTVGEYAVFVDAGGYRDDRLWNAEARSWRTELNVASPDAWDVQRAGPGNRPVVGVSCWECRAYCAYLGARLPSEAEWEYACRAGTKTRYGSGDGESDLERVGWYGENSGGRLHAVGEKPANPWGLHDMHGNVWEWCEDAWHDSYKGAPTDGSAWLDEASSARVLRGGSFRYAAGYARSAVRVRFEPGFRSVNLGFRPARSVTS